MANGDFKYLPRRADSDKIFQYKAFKIAKDLKYDGYQRGHASFVYNFLTKSLLAVVWKSKLF